MPIFFTYLFFILIALILLISIYYLIVYQLFWLHTTGIYSVLGIIIGFILSSFLIIVILDSEIFRFFLNKIENLKLEAKADNTGTIIININRLLKKFKKY